MSDKAGNRGERDGSVNGVAVDSNAKKIRTES